MEAKELMIGDWVYNSYHKKNIKWDYSEMFCPNGIPVIGRDLEPIPLTAEILEKNGFKNIDKLGAERCNGFNIYFKDGDGFSFNEHYFSLHYVHEFQHALRLCRLKHLADNFKV